MQGVDLRKQAWDVRSRPELPERTAALEALHRNAIEARLLPRATLGESLLNPHYDRMVREATGSLVPIAVERPPHCVAQSEAAERNLRSGNLSLDPAGIYGDKTIGDPTDAL
jgi:hypothetical protein